MCIGKTHERFLFRVWFPCKSVSQYVNKSSWVEEGGVEEQNIDFSLMLGEGSEAPVRNLSANCPYLDFPPKIMLFGLQKMSFIFRAGKSHFFIDCKGG